jgi:hypothetical protein
MGRLDLVSIGVCHVSYRLRMPFDLRIDPGSCLLCLADLMISGLTRWAECARGQ